MYLNLHKKHAFNFLKIISYTNVSLKFLCDAKLIMPLLPLLFLVKVWNENSISIPIHSVAVWVAKYQEGGEAKARGTNEQPLSVKPLLMRYGETYSAWQ